MYLAARMEFNLFMNRARDTAVNVLLACVLVAAFLLPFLLYLVAADYILWGLDQGVKHFLPKFAHPEVIFVGVLLLASLVQAVRHMWKRRRLRAFLWFAILPAIGSAVLADVHAPFSLHGPLWLFGLFPIYFIPETAEPTRTQFFLASAAISAVVAINAGMLGSGYRARIVAFCIVAGLFIRFVILVRRTSGGDPTRLDLPTPLSPTKA
jgi:hypothetical protein